MSNWLTRGRILRRNRLYSEIASVHSSSPVLPTCLAMDSDWIILGLSSGRVHIFNAHTGVIHRALVGHASGVWVVALVKGIRGGNTEGQSVHVSARGQLNMVEEDHAPSRESWTSLRSASVPPNPVLVGAESEEIRSKPYKSNKPSSPGGASDGWGEPHALVVTGGCDKDLRVWDVDSGYAFVKV